MNRAIKDFFGVLTIAAFVGVSATAAEVAGARAFHQNIKPILENYCFDCHADGAKKGNVAFDEFATDQAVVENQELWLHALKNLRAGLMPPPKKPQPTPEEKERISQWIKSAVFKIDPQNPDPGHVTLHRLNRVEYENTIRDLLGINYDAQSVFPPDDTGHGFDNIADVLTLPPMLLEKYVVAANQIVSQAVPMPTSKNTVKPENYKKFFPKPVPDDAKGRQTYARELLENFARRAFRRPPDKKTLDRLVSLAEGTYSQPGKTFESGVAQGMVAVLASPRFLFREERAEPSSGRSAYPFVDEFSLASRLSYLLWSSMPDEELLRLAEAGELRKNLTTQLERMLKDNRSKAFVRDFVGQWLRARDIDTVPIEAQFVLAREDASGRELEREQRRLRELKNIPERQLTQAERDELETLRASIRRARNAPPRADMNGGLRSAMRRETELCFEYILREDRSLLELLDADYTFLNERLATHYGITNVTGREMRRVNLPADSPRGGILTQGTVLGVTSNPTRTSPVKRGLFILDSILGTPPPPPPPDIPPLEDAAKGLTNRTPSLRETLAAHRENALCSSCHNHMDPLGLALENFNAMGRWRTTEFGEAIDATGSLVTGETFNDVRDLKHALVKNHRQDFYRTVTEKLLIYALGRGLEYYDVETCDQIVARVEAANGRASALIAGVVESAPFQKTRTADQSKPKPSAKPDQKRADANIKL